MGCILSLISLAATFKDQISADSPLSWQRAAEIQYSSGDQCWYKGEC